MTGANIETLVGTPVEPFIEVRRGSYLESVHSISACVARADGEILYASGNVHRAYPVRSLAKPFLVREVIRNGAADAYTLGDVELALAAGSHDGERRHVAGVRDFLAKVGVDEDALQCGPALEGRVAVGPPVANNCSGKHVALLALCRHLSLSTDGYTTAEHPAQQLLLPALLKAFGRKAVDTPLVVDGCSLPIFGASLHEIATAYARFGIADDPISMRVRDAMTAQPGYVGGWLGNLDTQIIEWSNGSIIGKIGAEGLHADTAVGRGLGIAIKVLDGNSRALAPTLVRFFLGFIDNVPIAQHHLAKLAAPAILNAVGGYVGDIRAITISTGVEFSDVHSSRRSTS